MYKSKFYRKKKDLKCIYAYRILKMPHSTLCVMVELTVIVIKNRNNNNLTKKKINHFNF